MGPGGPEGNFFRWAVKWGVLGGGGNRSFFRWAVYVWGGAVGETGNGVICFFRFVLRGFIRVFFRPFKKKLFKPKGAIHPPREH